MSSWIVILKGYAAPKNTIRRLLPSIVAHSIFWLPENEAYWGSVFYNSIVVIITVPASAQQRSSDCKSTVKALGNPRSRLIRTLRSEPSIFAVSILGSRRFQSVQYIDLQQARYPEASCWQNHWPRLFRCGVTDWEPRKDKILLTYREESDKRLHQVRAENGTFWGQRGSAGRKFYQPKLLRNGLVWSVF